MLEVIGRNTMLLVKWFVCFVGKRNTSLMRVPRDLHRISSKSPGAYSAYAMLTLLGALSNVLQMTIFPFSL